MAKHKSFNAFKMWGSWVGLIIGIVIIVFPKTSDCGFLLTDINCSAIQSAFSFSFTLGLIILSVPLLGFLIGWGIHSIFRAMRK